MEQEIQLRVSKIQKRMREDNVEGCLISSNVNLYYASGIIFIGYIYIPQQGDVIYFVKKPYTLHGKNIYIIRKPEQIPGILHEIRMPLPKTLWLEGDEMTHTQWSRLEKIFPDAKLIDSTHAIRQIRSVKTPFELDLVREGGCLQTEAIQAFPSLYKPGMTDQEYTVEMEHEIRKRGSLGIIRIFGESMEAFLGTVLSGENASEPSPYDFALGGKGLHPSLPIGQSNSVIQPKQTIMVDICGNFNGYHVDQTRIFSVGKTTNEAYYAHEVSKEIHYMFEEYVRPGVSCEDIFEKSWDIAHRHKLQDCFMGCSHQAKFVGHGIGLVLNELPVISGKNKDVIQAGMTIAFEPKFIVDGVGAVGNENTYIIHESSVEKTTNAPEEIIELL